MSLPDKIYYHNCYCHQKKNNRDLKLLLSVHCAKKRQLVIHSEHLRSTSQKAVPLLLSLFARRFMAIMKLHAIFFHPLPWAIFHFPGDEISSSLEGGWCHSLREGATVYAYNWTDGAIFLLFSLIDIFLKLCFAVPSQQDVEMNTLYLYYD